MSIFRLPIIAILATILFELLAIYSGRLINVDGILYLRSADAFLNHDYTLAYTIYRWPLYSILIAFVSQLSHSSLMTAAYLVNGFFQVLLTLSLLQLIKQLGGNRRCQWFLLGLILIHPNLHHYRHYVIRDFGYWACLFLGMSQWITAMNYQRSVYYLWGAVSLLLATAFRIEGLIFALLLPLSVLCCRHLKNRLQALSLGWLPLGAIVSAILVWAYWHQNIDLRQVGRIDHVLNVTYALPTIRDNIATIVTEMKSSVLDYQAQHGASVMVIGGLMVLMLFEIIKVTNPFLFLLSTYAVKRHFVPKSDAKRVCKIALAINLCILLYFIGTFNFLTGRYVMPISFIILLWAPFTIEHIYQYFCVCRTNTLKYWYYPLTIMVGIGFLIYNLSCWHYNKKYIREAGKWTQRHIQSQQVLISNSAEYLFYSRGIIKVWDQSFESDINSLLQQTSGNVIVAIKLNKKYSRKLLPTLQNWKFLATFQNNKGDRLIVMQKLL